MNFLTEKHQGLHLIAVQKTTPAQTFSANLNFKVGAGYESKQLAGISHYLEHSVFLGTKTRPNRSLVETNLLSFGGDYNAETSFGNTGYLLSGQLDSLEQGIASLYDLGMNATLEDEKELKKEKKVVLSELEQELTEDGQWADQAQVAYATLFEGTVLDQSVLGTKKTLKNINRGVLQEYHSRYYTPKNACLSMVTPLPPEKTIERMKSVDIPNIQDLWEYPGPKPVVASKKPFRKVRCIKTAAFTWELDYFYQFDLPDDPIHRVALSLMTLVLFHSEVSVLFGEARKKGLVYMARGGYMNYLDTHVYRIATNLSSDKASKFAALMRKQVAKLLKKGIDESFLKFCKAHYAFRRQQNLEQYEGYAYRIMEKDFLGMNVLLPKEELSYLPGVGEWDVLKMLRLVFEAPRQVITVKGPDATPELEDSLNKGELGL